MPGTGGGAGEGTGGRTVGKVASEAVGLAKGVAPARAGSAGDAERRERARQTNPVYVLRNHLAQRVIDAAHDGDFAPLDTLMRLLADPCTRRDGHADWEGPPPADTPAVAVSCSS